MTAPQVATPQPAGPPYKRIGFIETCEALKNSEYYRSPLTGPNRGRGVAAGFWFNGGLQSAAAVNLHNDGTLSVVTGSVDIGGSRGPEGEGPAEGLGGEARNRRPRGAGTASVRHTHGTRRGPPPPPPGV